jgi:hypothetical protein
LRILKNKIRGENLIMVEIIDKKLNKILFEDFRLGYLANFETGESVNIDSYGSIEEFERETKTTLTFNMNPKTMEYFLPILVRNCAEKILIVDYNYPKSILSNVYNNLSKGLRNRVEIIDKNHSYSKKVLNYLDPIYQELDLEYEHLRVNRIGKFLHKILLGCKYNAEVGIDNFWDIDFYIKSIRKRVTDKEANYRLDAIEGIYSLYTNSEVIDAITYYPISQDRSIEDKINSLFQESEIIDASNQRHLFGIPYFYKSAKYKFKRIIDKIKKDKKIYSGINFSKDVLLTSSGIPPKVIPDLPNISKYNDDTYNPPLMNLDCYRNEILSQILPFESSRLAIGGYGLLLPK